MQFQSFPKLISTRWVLLVSGLVTLVTAGLYLSIASSWLTNANYGSDGGDLLSATLTAGIPHPTGYPTYVLLGRVFQWIPFNTPVFRATLESLVPTALAAGLLAAWLGYILGSGSISTVVASALAGIAWGIAPLVFSQAVIVEVHGLQSLVVVLVLWWLTLNLDTSKRVNKKWLLALSFLFGLGFGNHLTLLFFVPAALLALIELLRHTRTWRFMLLEIGLVLAGLLVYLYLPLRAQAFPAINWGNPQTWPGFLWEVTANPYRAFLFGASPSTLVDRLRSTSSIFLDQFGALGLLAGVIGVIQYSFRIKWLRWILVYVFIVFIAFAIIYSSNDSAGYLVPALMVFAVWIGLAVPSLWGVTWRRFPMGAALVALLAIGILIRIPGTRLRIDPRPQNQPARYAEQFLDEAPANAIVYTTTDQDSFPLWYYHFGLHTRSDLRIIVLPLTRFPWYQQTLVHVYPDLSFPTLYTQDLPNADWGTGIAQLNPQRPVCRTSLTDKTETGITYQCSHP